MYGAKPSSDDPTPKKVVVSPGQGLRATSERMHRAGLIYKPHKFRLIARIKGYDKRIKAGEYVVSAAISPLEMLEIMVSGRVHQYKMTIPEGYTLRQVAASVADSGIGIESEFMRAAVDPALLLENPDRGGDLRGVPFPRTPISFQRAQPRGALFRPWSNGFAQCLPLNGRSGRKRSGLTGSSCRDPGVDHRKGGRGFRRDAGYFIGCFTTGSKSGCVLKAIRP